MFDKAIYKALPRKKFDRQIEPLGQLQRQILQITLLN